MFKSQSFVQLTALLVCMAAQALTQAADAKQATVHQYPTLKGDQVSDGFQLSVNGVEIPCAKYQKGGNHNFAVARFASDAATPTYTVSSAENIDQYKIYPERYYPADAVKVDGKTITFKMNASLRYAIVELNGKRPCLAIVNDPLEDSLQVPNPKAANVLSVTDFVKETTGQSDVTKMVKAAIDELFSNPKYDTLYFPNGTYLHSGLELRNRKGKQVTIYLNEGALLKNRIQPAVDSMEPAIGIWDSADITIAGRGMFDANGYGNYDTSRGGWRHDAKSSHHQGGVMVVRSSNIRFQDTYLRDSKQWNFETHEVQNVTFNNIKALTPYRQPWIDGINIASGQNVVINGALTLGNDDCFASGHYNPDDGFLAAKDRLTWDTDDTNNITLKNSLHWSCEAGNGIRIGHDAMGHKLLNYVFDNVNVVNFRGGGRGITVQNGRENLRTYPHYNSLIFKDCSFDTSRVTRNLQILGLDASTRINKVRIIDCWFSNANANFELKNINELMVSRLRLDGKQVASLPSKAFSMVNVTNPVLDFDVADSDDFRFKEGERPTLK